MPVAKLYIEAETRGMSSEAEGAGRTGSQESAWSSNWMRSEEKRFYVARLRGNWDKVWSVWKGDDRRWMQSGTSRARSRADES